MSSLEFGTVLLGWQRQLTSLIPREVKEDIYTNGAKNRGSRRLETWRYYRRRKGVDVTWIEIELPSVILGSND